MKTASHPAVACEPGVVPEPPAEPLGLTKLLLALHDNQLAVWNREAFVRDFGEGRLLFSNFVLVNEPELIEHVLATNHQNYIKGAAHPPDPPTGSGQRPRDQRG